MDWSWTEEAACIGVPSEYSTFGDVDADKLKKFAANYCGRCTVAQECLNAALIRHSDGHVTDDLEYTVRGGYLPTLSTGRVKGRPREGKNGESTLKFMLEDPDGYVEVILKWIARHGNTCPKGHEILDEFKDLKVTPRVSKAAQVQCRECVRATDRENSRKRYSRKPKKTHCRGGHLITPENSEIVWVKDKDRGERSYRRCKICRAASSKAADDRKRFHGKIAV